MDNIIEEIHVQGDKGKDKKVKVKCPFCDTEFETKVDCKDNLNLLEPEIVEVKGWKGKGEVEITSFNKNEGKLILRQYHKSKETSESYFQDSEVLFEDLEWLWKLLKKNCQIGQEYGSHYIWKLIITDKELDKIEGVAVDYMVQHFLGYRQKKKGTDYFFKYYYNLIKCYEKWGKLLYLGRGGIIRILDDELDL